jgi:hypothetical protein
MAVGNEGAGTVVKAGSSEAAQALLGKTVALIGGAMYAQYRVIKAKECLPLPEGTTATEGASCFVNPLTSLGMVETMKREGHTALVHTAAASNLGQMLNKICQKDGIDLVNIVRSEEQEKLLRGIGAKYVCNSTSPSFMEDLTAALIATNATLAFDATGGGKLQGQILQAMEVAAVKAMKVYSRYGSTTHKQVYVYGRLDLRPIEFVPAGMAWGMGGWLLFPFLQKWRLTGAGHARFPDTHAEMTVQMISAVITVFGEKGMDQLIGAREEAMRANYREAMNGARSLKTKLERLAEIRSREGYMAEFRPEGDGFLFIENHCPICTAARACTGLCRSELQLFEEVLGPEASVSRVEHVLAGARRCAYQVSPKGAP